MEQDEERGSKPARKPYKRPRLQVYGDLENLTNAVGSKGNYDGATRGKNRTHM